MRAAPLAGAVLVFLIGVELASRRFAEHNVVLPTATRWLVAVHRFLSFGNHAPPVWWHFAAKVAVKCIVILAFALMSVAAERQRSDVARRWLFWAGTVLLRVQLIVLGIPMLSM